MREFTFTITINLVTILNVIFLSMLMFSFNLYGLMLVDDQRRINHSPYLVPVGSKHEFLKEGLYAACPFLVWIILILDSYHFARLRAERKEK